jgi:hypothetical protein
MPSNVPTRAIPTAPHEADVTTESTCSPRSAIAARVLAEEEERTTPGPGTDGFERLGSGVCTRQTLSEHRRSGRAAMDNLRKDVGDQRIEGTR